MPPLGRVRTPTLEKAFASGIAMKVDVTVNTSISHATNNLRILSRETRTLVIGHCLKPCQAITEDPHRKYMDSNGYRAQLILKSTFATGATRIRWLYFLSRYCHCRGDSPQGR